jgi:hypothetical protein
VLISPEGELKLLKKLLDVPIYGVTSAVELSERRKAIKSLRRIYRNSLAKMGLQQFLCIQKVVRSVQNHGLLKIPLTLLRKGMMESVYENFLCEFRDKVGFKKYVDMC